MDLDVYSLQKFAWRQNPNENVLRVSFHRAARLQTQGSQAEWTTCRKCGIELLGPCKIHLHHHLVVKSSTVAPLVRLTTAKVLHKPNHRRIVFNKAAGREKKKPNYIWPWGLPVLWENLPHCSTAYHSPGWISSSSAHSCDSVTHTPADWGVFQPIPSTGVFWTTVSLSGSTATDRYMTLSSDSSGTSQYSSRLRLA